MARGERGCSLDHKHAAYSRRLRISLCRTALEVGGPQTRGPPSPAHRPRLPGGAPDAGRKLTKHPSEERKHRMKARNRWVLTMVVLAAALLVTGGNGGIYRGGEALAED